MSSIYKVKFSSDAEKTLGKIEKPLASRIFSTLEQLSENPYKHPHTKKMKGKEDNVYRLRVGNFRIIYEIINNELIVFVVRIGPRGDVYK